MAQQSGTLDISLSVVVPAYSVLIRILFSIRLKDALCPFKFFRKSALDIADLHSNGFLIDTKIIFKALRNNIRIKELGLASQPRKKGASTVRFRHVTEGVKELAILLVSTRKRYDKGGSS